jgi:hypothetical protein
VFTALSAQLDRELSALNQVWAQDLEAFNRLLRARRLAPVTRTPLRVEEGTAGTSRAGGDEGEEEGEARRW